jgi:hypothetical protein
LLEVFLRHPGQVLSREQLLSHVWGDDYDPSSNRPDGGSDVAAPRAGRSQPASPVGRHGCWLAHVAAPGQIDRDTEQQRAGGQETRCPVTQMVQVFADTAARRIWCAAAPS